MTATVIPQTEPAATPIPGVAHATWAGAAEGLSQLSIWRQRLAPGAATPPHRHGEDEVVLCLSGRGEVHLDGRIHHFGGGDTIVLPRGTLHQIFSAAGEALEIIGVLGGSPVSTYLPHGELLPLPWRS